MSVEVIAYLILFNVLRCSFLSGFFCFQIDRICFRLCFFHHLIGFGGFGLICSGFSLPFVFFEFGDDWEEFGLDDLFEHLEVEDGMGDQEDDHDDDVAYQAISTSKNPIVLMAD